MWQAVPGRCLTNYDYITRIEYIIEENVTPLVIWATTPAGGGDDEKSNTIWKVQRLVTLPGHVRQQMTRHLISLIAITSVIVSYSLNVHVLYTFYNRQSWKLP